MFLLWKELSLKRKMWLENMLFKNLRLINMKYLNNLLDKVKDERILINGFIESY